ncbi:DUF3426 domain-containing protein [Pelagibius sp. Alg239-R121]|uniref:DUF3426 domain-containing protein n=1 Tax=Pelagibius sp. Alg239-R121 TaxID=2993448 RepID=UPI0024A6E925|nr:DUF3426 domain-containing protein [Pelagibius sp. Alg239-R121]
MIVTCPSCDTSFALDESLLGTRGRKVKCGECAHRWHQMPEAATAPVAAVPEAAAPEPIAEPESAAAEPTEAVQAAPEPEAVEVPPPMQEEETAADTPPPVRGPKLFESDDEDVLDDGDRRFAVLGWSIFLVVFVLLVLGFYFGQSQIVAFEPRFQKLYDLVGLKAHSDQDGHEEVAGVPGEGLSIPADKLLKSRKRVAGEPMIVVEGVVVNETDQEQPVPTLRATITDVDANILARWYFEAETAKVGLNGDVSFETSIGDSWGRQSIGISIIFVSAETAENEPSILPTATKQ